MPGTSRIDLPGILAELGQEPRPFLYVPNPGNAGDAMIAHATRQLFDRLGLDYEWVSDPRVCDPRNRVVVYGGGGNLIPQYHTAKQFLRRANGSASRLILLPHTVVGHEELLADLGPQTDLICRELVSYDHVRGAVGAARVHLADDLAFGLDVESTLSTPPAAMSALRLYGRRLRYRFTAPSQRRSVASPRRLRRSGRMFTARRRRMERGGAPAVLHAFRTDAERTGIPLPDDNLDLSRLMAFGTRDANVCHTGTLHVLRYLDLYDEVRTNRLHLAIGAALLGKRVRLHPNSYFKNRAVYEFSIRGRFPDVEWAS
jgi:exopolysaccharide biosynthesis predicted pyruvyltransferase EpsI